MFNFVIQLQVLSLYGSSHSGCGSGWCGKYSDSSEEV